MNGMATTVTDCKTAHYTRIQRPFNCAKRRSCKWGIRCSSWRQLVSRRRDQHHILVSSGDFCLMSSSSHLILTIAPHLQGCHTQWTQTELGTAGHWYNEVVFSAKALLNTNGFWWPRDICQPISFPRIIWSCRQCCWAFGKHLWRTQHQGVHNQSRNLQCLKASRPKRQVFTYGRPFDVKVAFWCTLEFLLSLLLVLRHSSSFCSAWPVLISLLAATSTEWLHWLAPLEELQQPHSPL